MAGQTALQGIDTLIAQGCEIEGDLVFCGGLRIAGRVNGDVRAEPAESGYLMLARTGLIQGEIRVAHVVIDGQVEGNLHIAGRVELLARARIIGNIHYVSLAMEPGAAVVGQLHPESLPSLTVATLSEPLLKLA